MEKYKFLFEELLKRDFKKKYKRTVLGMAWSMLSPLLMLLVMKVVFESYFGRSIPHYTTYIFCGLLIFNWFAESTNSGMRSLMENSSIFSKVNVPKYLFLFARNAQTLLNFGLSLIVFCVFCVIDGVNFTWKFIFLLYPLVTLMAMNLGVGLVLSAFFMFFRDIDYLWSVFMQLLMYGSAVFYLVDNKFSPLIKLAFACNPIYRHIEYVREIVLNGVIPTWETHLVLLGFALVALLAGGGMYKHYNTKFLYYV